MRADANKESDGILHYEPAKDPTGDGFVLVIMNPKQRQWLGKYGPRAVCVDDTFNLTAYALRLATIVVADEWDRALPAAYLLSYRMTEAEVGTLFTYVKEFLPSFYTEYFMSDDTNTFWNGFKQVFPSSSAKRLLCLWHVQQTFKRNATRKLLNVKAAFGTIFKQNTQCMSARDRTLFVAKYASVLRFLRDKGEHELATYIENSWSDRVDQWAAFGRMGSCVSTSMLCERFHKRLKHDILEGKANVRIDRLLDILITLTVEMEEEREIMMERGLEEGRFRLQQHHRSHALAVKKYSDKQDLITVVGSRSWEVRDGSNVFIVQEQFCPCDEKLNNHCRRGCNACPYSFACTCSMDVKSGISCEHVHAVLLYASRRSVASESVNPQPEVSAAPETFDSDDQEIPPEIAIDDFEQTEETPARRRSTDIRDSHKDMYQRIEAMYAATRIHALGLINNADERVTEGFEKVLGMMEQVNRTMASLASEFNCSTPSQQIARRPEFPATGRPPMATPIRRLQKRSLLRKEEQMRKKSRIEEIPDYPPNKRDTCAVCFDSNQAP
ncbi:hypothetical protein OESDEN_16415 [Oesophagostomum dentatum]|uniref:SWIM-type domain-containing protein n=1 Tax=Oesophagostomum dentatum TaxID=61180 RepID=A0A0B1SEY0_OESDE|nr:hypothetical protein OESDEN_16415 [Oesophagostomum dentatum]